MLESDLTSGVFLGDGGWGYSDHQASVAVGNSWVETYGGTTTTTPEPVSMIFFATGLVAVGGYMARRRMLRKS